MPSAMRDGGRLVVVGGVAAGMSAASRARRVRPDIEIVVLEKGGDVSYGACSLPYYISGVVPERGDLVAYEADFFRRERSIDVRLHTEAVSLDPARRTVAIRSGGEMGALDFDALVLATGAYPVRPPLPGMDTDGVLTLRTLADGDALKKRLEDGRVHDVAVVGGGYIGLEMAESFSELGLSVTVLELLPVVLPNYDEDMSSLVVRELADRGVALHTGVAVEGFEAGESGGRVSYVVAGGRRIPTDLVMVSVGVRPATALAESAGIELGATGAIKVDARQVTSVHSVLAAGDCCEARHVVTGKPVWIPLGTTANKQGKIAGENAVGGNARFGGVAGTNATKVFGLEVAQTGLSAGAAEREGYSFDSVRITARTRSHAYPGSERLTVKLVFERGSGRVIGAQMVGREGAAKRIDTVAAAIHAGMNVQDLAEIDMSYAPPFSPVWDPILVAAGQAVKRLRQ